MAKKPAAQPTIIISYLKIAMRENKKKTYGYI
jgi:hypothetical protein